MPIDEVVDKPVEGTAAQRTAQNAASLGEQNATRGAEPRAANLVLQWSFVGFSRDRFVWSAK